MRQMLLSRLWLVVGIPVLLTFGYRTDVGAYESATVVNGAAVWGKVTFAGTVPDPKEFELRRSPDRVYCGALSDGNGIGS